jgi:hypothetical protein
MMEKMISISQKKSILYIEINSNKKVDTVSLVKTTNM